MDFRPLLVTKNQFSARVFLAGDCPVMEIADETLRAIDGLWENAWQSTTLFDASGKRMADIDGSVLSLDRVKHLSLTWLVLHELMHLRLEHLTLLGEAQLIETEDEQAVAQINHKNLFPALRDSLSKTEFYLVRPCLELQADNDATEIMFGTYAQSEWNRFRIEVAAIFVVMALMQKADTKQGDDARVYPLVATRFFTLFAQLFQYWLYPDAKLRRENAESFVHTPRPPEGEDFQRYMKEVLAFSISDAVQIAHWAEADVFLKDMGESSAMFRDIFEIQYAEDLAKADLQTNAANEWRKLLPINEKIMAASGLRD